MTRFLTIIMAIAVSTTVLAKEDSGKKKLEFGYDGGMMLHTGYLCGTIPEIGYEAKGMPTGIGGAIKFHIGKYFRVGTEGYVSTMKQMKNGSTIKFGWGGILADVRFTTRILMPYIGATIGGGARTSTLMFEGSNKDWKEEESVIFHKQPFLAIAPFIGTDFIVTKKFHLTLKVDYLCSISEGTLLMPAGPRLYFGFLMFH